MARGAEIFAETSRGAAAANKTWTVRRDAPVLPARYALVDKADEVVVEFGSSGTDEVMTVYLNGIYVGAYGETRSSYESKTGHDLGDGFAFYEGAKLVGLRGDAALAGTGATCHCDVTSRGTDLQDFEAAGATIRLHVNDNGDGQSAFVIKDEANHVAAWLSLADDGNYGPHVCLNSGMSTDQNNGDCWYFETDVSYYRRRPKSLPISARRRPFALILAALDCGRRRHSNAGESKANARNLERPRRHRINSNAAVAVVFSMDGPPISVYLNGKLLSDANSFSWPTGREYAEATGVDFGRERWRIEWADAYVYSMAVRPTGKLSAYRRRAARRRSVLRDALALAFAKRFSRGRRIARRRPLKDVHSPLAGRGAAAAAARIFRGRGPTEQPWAFAKSPSRGRRLRSN